jgi:hypothetical protein
MSTCETVWRLSTVLPELPSESDYIKISLSAFTPGALEHRYEMVSARWPSRPNSAMLHGSADTKLTQPCTALREK